jgi:ribosome-associated heat shock protein Hsp15
LRPPGAGPGTGPGTGAAAGSATESAGGPAKIRIDKWLWQARFFKSRGLAGEVAGSGAVRVNGERIAKPAHGVRVGDVLTFPQARHIRVVRVLGLGTRRGPAAEAQALYDDLDPAAPRAAREDAAEVKAGLHEQGSARPTKRERREIAALRRRDP